VSRLRADDDDGRLRRELMGACGGPCKALCVGQKGEVCSMGTNGEFFNFPTTYEEWQRCWEEAEVLSDDMIPDWMRDNDQVDDEWRYVGHSTWAYLSREEQERYFQELEDLWDNDYITMDGDDGDGCVTHFYVRKPDCVEVCDGSKE